jgi:hypothetical protein
MDRNTLSQDQTKVLQDFAHHVQRGRHSAARALFEGNEWLADVDGSPVSFEWFDLPLGKTGAKTLQASLDTLNFLLEKKFKMKFDGPWLPYDRVMNWFEQDPNHPHVCWFRENGLISDKQAADYRKRRQDETVARAAKKISDVEKLNSCSSPALRLEVISSNMQSWLSGINLVWAESLRSEEEAKAAMKAVRAAQKVIKQDPALQNGTASLAGMKIMEKLFENPEWASQSLILEIMRSAKEGEGMVGPLFALGEPWHSKISIARKFAASVDQLSDEAAPMWLSLAINGLMNANCYRGPPNPDIAATKDVCHLVIGSLLERCGASAVNERIVRKEWRTVLSADELVLVENQEPVKSGTTPPPSRARVAKC